MSKADIKRIGTEVHCASLRLENRPQGFYMNEVHFPAGLYFTDGTWNFSVIAEELEWLEDDGATPTQELVNPPLDYTLDEYKRLKHLDYETDGLA